MSCGAVAEVLLDEADHPRREALVDEQPVAGVLRRVGHQHHLAAHVERAVRCDVQLDHVDAARLGAEPLGVAVDEPEVGVLGDRPEAGAVGFLGPVHRVLGPEHAEHLVMLHAAETVHVEQIDVVELHGPKTRTCSSIRHDPAGSVYGSDGLTGGCRPERAGQVMKGATRSFGRPMIALSPLTITGRCISRGCCTNRSATASGVV